MCYVTIRITKHLLTRNKVMNIRFFLHSMLMSSIFGHHATEYRHSSEFWPRSTEKYPHFHDLLSDWSWLKFRNIPVLRVGMSVSVRLPLYSHAWSSFRVKMIIFDGVLVIILSETAKCSAVITSLNNGVFNFVNFNSSMEPSSSKRCHVASGTTPNKPAKKQTRDVNRKIRKPLSFSSENVPLENESYGLVSPEIKMRSRCSPGFKVSWFFCC